MLRVTFQIQTTASFTIIVCQVFIQSWSVPRVYGTQRLARVVHGPRMPCVWRHQQRADQLPLKFTQRQRRLLCTAQSSVRMASHSSTRIRMIARRTTSVMRVATECSSVSQVSSMIRVGISVTGRRVSIASTPVPLTESA